MLVIVLFPELTELLLITDNRLLHAHLRSHTSHKATFHWEDFYFNCVFYSTSFHLSVHGYGILKDFVHVYYSNNITVGIFYE